MDGWRDVHIGVFTPLRGFNNFVVPILHGYTLLHEVTEPETPKT